jgi:hypothetical protein
MLSYTQLDKFSDGHVVKSLNAKFFLYHLTTIKQLITSSIYARGKLSFK